MDDKPRVPSEPAKVGDTNIAPNTTAAADKVSAGQRRVNLIWEVMQAFIAGSVVGGGLFIAGTLSYVAVNPAVTERQVAIASGAFLLISNLVSLVIGFYFGRTNHQRTGGVGPHDIGR